MNPSTLQLRYSGTWRGPDYEFYSKKFFWEKQLWGKDGSSKTALRSWVSQVQTRQAPPPKIKLNFPDFSLQSDSLGTLATHPVPVLWFKFHVHDSYYSVYLLVSLFGYVVADSGFGPRSHLLSLNSWHSASLAALALAPIHLILFYYFFVLCQAMLGGQGTST